jgi:hypothetical protein
MVILCKVQVWESQAFDRYQQDRRNPDAGFDSGKAVSDSTVLYFLWGGARKGAYPMFLVYFVGDELSKLWLYKLYRNCIFMKFFDIISFDVNWNKKK